MAATPLCENGIARVQFHAGHVTVFLLTVCANTHLAGSDSLHTSRFVKKHFRCGEAWIDLHSESFSLLGQPAANVAH